MNHPGLLYAFFLFCLFFLFFFQLLSFAFVSFFSRSRHEFRVFFPRSPSTTSREQFCTLFRYHQVSSLALREGREARGGTTSRKPAVFLCSSENFSIFLFSSFLQLFIASPNRLTCNFYFGKARGGTPERGPVFHCSENSLSRA